MRDTWKPANFDVWEALAPKYKQLLEVELAPLRVVVTTSANAAAANDYIKAGQIASGSYMLREAATAMKTAVVPYVDKRALFDAEFTKVENHAGRPGIEDFYLRAKADHDFVEARVARREFAAAASILDAVQPLFAPQLVLAEEYKNYAVKKKNITDQILVIKDSNKAGTANAEMAVVDKYLAAATAQETAKKFALAETALNEALARANAAKALLEKEQTLTALKPPAGADLGAVQARANAYPAMKNNVQSQGDPSFTPVAELGRRCLQRGACQTEGSGRSRGRRGRAGSRRANPQGHADQDRPQAELHDQPRQGRIAGQYHFARTECRSQEMYR